MTHRTLIAVALCLACSGSPSTPTPQANSSSSGSEPATQPTPPAPITTPTPTPPPAATDATPSGFPAPPPYVEIQTRLSSAPDGSQCFQHNVLQADLTESFADGDLDGDRHPERVWQTPDCLVVITQGSSAWVLSRFLSRPVAREVNRVRLRIIGPSGNRLLEVTDTRESPLTRESYRFRWDGHQLSPAP